MKTDQLLEGSINLRVQKTQANFFNSNLNLKYIFSVFLFAMFMLSTTDVQATHFRGGTLSWSQAGGNTINFTSNTQWRYSYSPFGSPSVNDVLSLGTMEFGDGTTITLSAKVTAIDLANDILFMSWVYTKTYATAGDYEVSAYNSCCRTSDLQDSNNDEGYSLKATVNVGGTFNNPPVSTVQQVVNLPIGTPNASFKIGAVDPDGDTVSYRLSTGSESGLVTINPVGLSLNTSTGVVTMDTTTRSLGQVFSIQFMVMDSQSKVPVDIKLVMIGASDPPTFVAPSPANNTVYTTTPPGGTVSFTIAATDPDVGQSTTLNAVALPIGATMTPLLPVTSAAGGTATSTFSWTPTVGQAGETVLLNFVAQDDAGIQTTLSITIHVQCAMNATIANSTDPSAIGTDDGSISVNVQNASGPGNLIYSWKGPNGYTSAQKDISGLAPGDYELRVNDTDTGCLAILAKTLAVPTSTHSLMCPADVAVDSDAGICGATNVNLGTPTITNNSPATGNAIDFGSVNNGMTIPDFSQVLVDADAATISAWIYPRTYNPNFPSLLSFVQTVLKVNEWQHLALTLDGTTLKVYHNGILIGTVTSTADISTYASASFLQILAGNSPYSLDGKLDEVQIWSVVRTQAEIQTDMNNEIVAQTNLVALYHFNQGIAGGNNTGETTVMDSSGNGYDITLNNFTLTGATSNWVEGKTFSGVTLTNDAPTLYVPVVFNVDDLTITWTGTNSVVYPIGDTMVTWTSTDMSGHTESCVQTVTVSLPAFVWTGNTDTDWLNNANWQSNMSPSLAVNSTVSIPTGRPNYPVITTGQNLGISACSTVTVDSGASLTINANAVLVNNGTVTNNGVLTFKSDVTGSAYIGSGTGTFTGDATVERYIPAKRAYRQLASPVTTSTFIKNNWQADTHITGSTIGANGFDATNTGNPSMYAFDNIGGAGYEQMANTDATNLIPGIMYHTLIRGDRSIDLTNNDPAPTVTTLQATGELTAENSGSKTLTFNVPQQQFLAVGNPYQAQVDMNTILTVGATNVAPNYYWVWDPKLGTRGAFVSVFAVDGDSSSPSSAANQYLQAGQSGWIQTAAAGATSVSFTQASKMTSSPETATFKSSGKKESVAKLRLSLYETNALAANKTAQDGFLIRFENEGNNAIDEKDAPDMSNLDENFATNNNGALLSIETRATPINGDEILLDINTYTNTNYTIVATATSTEGATAYLYDAFTDVSTEIPHNGSVNYAFSVNSNDAASIANDRFRIEYVAKSLSVVTNEMEYIKLYPNPSKSGKFYLDIPQNMDDLEVTIYNVLGAKLYSQSGFTAGKATVNANLAISQGVYFVKLSSKGKTTTKKLNIN